MAEQTTDSSAMNHDRTLRRLAGPRRAALAAITILVVAASAGTAALRSLSAGIERSSYTMPRA